MTHTNISGIKKNIGPTAVDVDVDVSIEIFGMRLNLSTIYLEIAMAWDLLVEPNQNVINGQLCGNTKSTFNWSSFILRPNPGHSPLLPSNSNSIPCNYFWKSMLETPAGVSFHLHLINQIPFEGSEKQCGQHKKKCVYLHVYHWYTTLAVEYMYVCIKTFKNTL